MAAKRKSKTGKRMSAGKPSAVGKHSTGKRSAVGKPSTVGEQPTTGERPGVDNRHGGISEVPPPPAAGPAHGLWQLASQGRGSTRSRRYAFRRS